MKYFAEHISYKLNIFEKAMETCGYNQIIIASGAMDYQFSDDLPLVYITNAYFREWLPLLRNPDSYLVIKRGEKKPKLLLKIVADYWHSEPQGLPAFIQNTIEVIEYTTAKDLDLQLSLSAKAAFIGPLNSQIKAIKDNNPQQLLSYIDYHRAWKSQYEMENMREANRLAVRGHNVAVELFHQGMSEYEIHMAYLCAIGCREEELPYSNIIALNKNCAVLHHKVLGTKRPEENLSLLIDAGAQFNGYASDITRTVVKDAGDDCFSALIKGTDDLQQSLVAALKPGLDYGELHLLAHFKIATLLESLNIINIPPEQAVSCRLTSAFFPHGLGHLIGVQVHDKGGHLAGVDGTKKAPYEEHPFLRCTRTIEPGMAFTIEPGIYFIPMLLQLWREKSDWVNWPLVDKLLPYGGVRIEDDVIVHEDCVENLTRDAFASYP